MGFLYKHYEKIILAASLLVFVIALVYLIMVFSKSKEVSEDDLMLRPTGSNYTSIFDENGKEVVPEGEKPHYAILDNLKAETIWRHSVKRDPASLDFSDLMIPFKAARCAKCKKLIPIVAFKQHKCPLCGEPPGKVKKVDIIDTGRDTDGDGMPDKYEIKYHLDPASAEDKFTDKDGDGFSNFIEFESKTSPDDPKMHPPLADRLALVRIIRKKLSLKLIKVQKRDSDDKKSWIIEMKVIGRRGRPVTLFSKIGDEIKIGKNGQDVYTITDAEYKVGEKFDPRLKQPVPVNISEIVIQNALDSTDKPITVVVNKPVYENTIRLGFKDTVTGKSYVLKKGASFTMGDAKTGIEEYTVTEVDLKGKQWAEIRDKAGKVFKIGKTSLIDSAQDGDASAHKTDEKTAEPVNRSHSNSSGSSTAVPDFGL